MTVLQIHYWVAAAWMLYGVIYVAQQISTCHKTVVAASPVEVRGLRLALLRLYWYEVFLGPLLWFRADDVWQYTNSNYRLALIEHLSNEGTDNE